MVWFQEKAVELCKYMAHWREDEPEMEGIPSLLLWRRRSLLWVTRRDINSPSMASRWRGAGSQGLSSEEGGRWAVRSEGHRSRSPGRMSVWLLQWLLTSYLTWMHFSFLHCEMGIIIFPLGLCLAMITYMVGHDKCQWLCLPAAQEAKWLLEKGNIPRACSCETSLEPHILWSHF